MRPSPGRDLREFGVLTLFMHGDDDQIVPIDASGRLSAKLVKGAVLEVYPGAPHGMAETIRERINADLLDFVQG